MKHYKLTYNGNNYFITPDKDVIRVVYVGELFSHVRVEDEQERKAILEYYEQCLAVEQELTRL